MGEWIEERQALITVLILINAVVLGLQTSDDIANGRLGGLLDVLDVVILGIFVVELLIKLVAYGPGFFRNGWNVFDFLVVGVALIPASGPLAILRTLRILRVLRLLSQVERLRMIVESLLRALPGMGWTSLLLLLVFYVFSVMGTELFGDEFPQWFGSIDDSAFSLFQIMTLESWSSGIARPVMETYQLAWLYFVPFILIASFMVLNLFIAIIVSATQSWHADEEEIKRQELAEDVAAIRVQLDEISAALKLRPPG